MVDIGINHAEVGAVSELSTPQMIDCDQMSGPMTTELEEVEFLTLRDNVCLLYTSPSPRDS